MCHNLVADAFYPEKLFERCHVPHIMILTGIFNDLHILVNGMLFCSITWIFWSLTCISLVDVLQLWSTIWILWMITIIFLVNDLLFLIDNLHFSGRWLTICVGDKDIFCFSDIFGHKLIPNVKKSILESFKLQLSRPIYITFPPFYFYSFSADLWRIYLMDICWSLTWLCMMMRQFFLIFVCFVVKFKGFLWIFF